MREPREITASQTMMTITNSMIGVSILILPRVASEIVNSGAILLVAFSLLLVFIGMLTMTLLGARFPNTSLIQYSKKIVGRPIAYLFGFMILALFILLVGLITSEFSVMLKSFLYPDTPIIVLFGTIMLVVAITTRNDITTIAYIQFFYFPFLVVPILLLVVLSFPEIELRHLKPITGNGTSLTDFLHGGVTIASLPFVQIGIFIQAVLIPHTKDAKHAIRGGLLGILLSGTIILLSVFITLGVFGMNEMKSPIWPLYTLTRMIQLPIDLLERLDIIYLIVWILSAYTTILSGYLIIVYLGSQLFRLKSHRMLSYLMLPFVFFVASYPKNIFQIFTLLKTIGLYGLVLTVIYPLILIVLSIVRKLKGEVKNETL